MSARLLLITDQSTQVSLADAWELRSLNYAFYDQAREDYLTAWRLDQNSLGVQVSARSLAGGFRQQALNRLVAQELMQSSYLAVILVGLYGCTIDLPRICHLLGIPVIWIIPSQSSLASLDKQGRACLLDALNKSALVCDPAGVLRELNVDCVADVSAVESHVQDLSRTTSARAVNGFDYSLYEFSQRDHPLLCLFQEQDVRHFRGCRRVLDMGAGVGLFVGLLQEESIPAVGVERNPALVDYGRGMGLDLIEADALEFLYTTDQQFDAVYCSHFVEHLPVAQVQSLLKGLARVLEEGGLAVVVFPDPESIRAQLFGFWRDPEHVRFYHPDLVASLALAAGLSCEWSSYEDQPHQTNFFPLEPPPLSPWPELSSPADLAINQINGGGVLSRLWRRLGLADAQQLQRLDARVQQQQKIIVQQQQLIKELADRSEQLWAINRTWGWRDSVVLKLRKTTKK